MRLISRDAQRDYRWAVAILFVAWLALPMIWQATRLATLWLGLVPTSGARITADDLPAIERWLERTFPFRAQIFGFYNHLRLSLFGEAPATVVLGLDGWLFYRSEAASDGEGLDDFAGLVVPGSDEIARWRDVVTARHASLAARGIAYVATVAPNKHSIYPDRLPLALQGRRGRSRLDRVADALADPASGFADLRPALLAARQRELVYFRIDTHWNDAGAYAAYRAIVEALARQRPGLAPLPRDCFRIEPGPRGGDIAQMIRITMLESVEHWRPREPAPAGCAAMDGSARRLTLVMFGDSSTDGLLPFLQSQFDVIGAGVGFSPELVRRLAPDLVVHLFVERHLPRLFGPSLGPEEAAPP